MSARGCGSAGGFFLQGKTVCAGVSCGILERGLEGSVSCLTFGDLLISSSRLIRLCRNEGVAFSRETGSLETDLPNLDQEQMVPDSFSKSMLLGTLGFWATARCARKCKVRGDLPCLILISWTLRYFAKFRFDLSSVVLVDSFASRSTSKGESNADKFRPSSAKNFSSELQ